MAMQDGDSGETVQSSFWLWLGVGLLAVVLTEPLLRDAKFDRFFPGHAAIRKRVARKRRRNR